MKKFHVLRVIATTMFAIVLLMASSVSVKAMKQDQIEVEQLGVDPTPSISFGELYQEGPVIDEWTIKFSKLPEGKTLFFNIYQGSKENTFSGEWNKDEKGDMYFAAYYNYIESKGSDSLIIENSYFPMGTYMVEAYLYDYQAYDLAEKACNDAWDRYYNGEITYDQVPDSPDWFDFIQRVPSNVLSFTVKKQPEVSTVIKSTSIQLNMYEDEVTGYEIYRKIGKKYKKIAKVAKNVYVDKGLVSKTTYSYKVRPYYFNEKLGKTEYGLYRQVDATTVGSALKLKSKIVGKKNIKLSWNKVPGAIKYEVYKRVFISSTSENEKGYDNSYSVDKLIKTLKKKANSYTDKKTLVDQSYYYIVKAVFPNGDKMEIKESTSVSLEFDAPRIITYQNANGVTTVEWEPVYGADGYLIKKAEKKYNADDDCWETEYVDYKKVNKNTTKMSFNPPTPTKVKYKDSEGNENTEWLGLNDYYCIGAYKNNGKILSTSADYFQVTKELPAVTNVTAKKVDNGIRVSWTPVPGATYYEVYRIKEGSLHKNKDSGCYFPRGDYLPVTEYVGAQAPVPVDVAAYNASQKDDYYKLDTDKTYYYTNYQYKQRKFTSTSILDYSGEIFGHLDCVDGDDWRKYEYRWNDGVCGTVPIVKEPSRNYKVGPKPGVSYQYVVVAYFAEEKTVEDYDSQEEYDESIKLYAAIPGTLKAQLIGTKPNWEDSLYQSLGCKKIGKATYTKVNTPKKTSIKSLKPGKKSVTISIKKSAGAKAYRIYRATKKKGPFQYVATTTKTKYKDKGLKSGKKYYYRVVVVKENEAKADLYSPTSKVKNVKVK